MEFIKSLEKFCAKMTVLRSGRKTKKTKKKVCFNRRDIMYSIINYKILICRLLQNCKIQMEPYKPGL